MCGRWDAVLTWKRLFKSGQEPCDFFFFMMHVFYVHVLAEVGKPDKEGC